MTIAMTREGQLAGTRGCLLGGAIRRVMGTMMEIDETGRGRGSPKPTTKPEPFTMSQDI